MIWRLRRIDDAILDAFEDAGQPDQRVIDAYLARTRRPMQPARHEDEQRFYYLLRDNPRVRLATIGKPLSQWHGEAAKIIVGTNEIIGEFAGNREFTGKRGLQLKVEPVAWLRGEADLVLLDGAALLAEISEQILDKRGIDRSQRSTKRRYEWK